MNRRDFIKSASAALIAASLPMTIEATPVVYYIDLAIAGLSLPRLVLWGDPQQHAVVELTHREMIGKPLDIKDELFEKKISQATGLGEFKIEPHPWQADMEAKMAELEESLDLWDDE